MAYYIEPVYYKYFVRFLSTVSNYFSKADNALLDYAANIDFGIAFTYRTSQTDGSTTWRTICEKIGTGASVAGTGWTVAMDTNTGQLRVTLNHDDGATALHTDQYVTTTVGLNDGKVRTAVFWIDRTSDAADKAKWYLGEAGEITAMAQDSSFSSAHTAMSLENNGAFTISDATAGNRWIGDIFILRIFNNLVLTSAMATAMNGDLSQRIDALGIAALVYTTDPSVTSGCVAEYCKSKPSVYTEWDTLEDTSGNDLDAVVASEDCYYHWGRHLLPKSSYTLSTQYSPEDGGVNKDTKIANFLLAPGGVDIGFGQFGSRTINFKGLYDGAAASTLDSYLLTLVNNLGKSDGRLRDSDRNSGVGFLRYSNIGNFRSPYQLPSRSMSQVSFSLVCPDPAWHNTFKQSAVQTVNTTTSPVTFSITNSGNVDCSCIWAIASGIDDNGYVKVENLNEEVNGSPIWFGLNLANALYFWRRPGDGGDDHGKVIVVDGEQGLVSFLGIHYPNTDYCNKMNYFTGEFFRLKPGENKIRLTITGGTGVGTAYVHCDFWEKYI